LGADLKASNQPKRGGKEKELDEMIVQFYSMPPRLERSQIL